jgi:hypothetical protein
MCGTLVLESKVYEVIGERETEYNQDCSLIIFGYKTEIRGGRAHVQKESVTFATSTVVIKLEKVRYDDTAPRCMI